MDGKNYFCTFLFKEDGICQFLINNIDKIYPFPYYECEEQLGIFEGVGYNRYFELTPPDNINYTTVPYFPGPNPNFFEWQRDSIYAINFTYFVTSGEGGLFLPVDSGRYGLHLQGSTSCDKGVRVTNCPTLLQGDFSLSCELNLFSELSLTNLSKGITSINEFVIKRIT
jgi:hypothetical protein